MRPRSGVSITAEPELKPAPSLGFLEDGSDRRYAECQLNKGDPDMFRGWNFLFATILGLLLPATGPLQALAGPEARVWITTQDMKQRLTEGSAVSVSIGTPSGGPSITIDENKKHQTMLGMGSSLEPTTCFNLSRLTAAERDETIEKLVHPEKGIGFNLVRVCIGTPDFTGDPWYSYDDMPAGEKDPNLERFSIEKDNAYILPALKIARAKNPDLLFFASPWSPPGWMKSNGTMIGGRLLPENYAAYAQYFVRFIQSYEKEGIPIHAVTVQNEPGVNREKAFPKKWQYPSCKWTGEEERDFIKNHLGPAFRKAGLKTKIWCYDHNFNIGPTKEADDPGLPYPRAILSDPAAAAYVDGTAFHGYEGKPDAMTAFHGEFPEKPIYFTEGSVFGLRGALRLIDLLRNQASVFNGWVTMCDEDGKPNNGPFKATRTMITLDPKAVKVTYNFDYYMLGHFTKFVKRGAVRIESTPTLWKFPEVAFRNPDGTIVLILTNPGNDPVSPAIMWNGSHTSVTMPAKSIATVVLKP